MKERFDARERPKVAVIQLPGVNCEYETRAALERADLIAEILRWNESDARLEEFDAYVLPGGFSYEDRIRAGAVAAKAPVLEVIGRRAEAGAPVLGICNGAQILVEAGLVPGNGSGQVEMALARNRGWEGYYCSWVYVRVQKQGRETAFTSRFEDGEIFPVPLAHGEGCFTVRDRDLFRSWMDSGQVPLRYVSPDGDEDPAFPWNPNGSLLGAAGVTNPNGNVLAFMPHPERGARLRQVPERTEGVWGSRRRAAARRRDLLDAPGPGFKLFQSLADYLRWGRGVEVMTQAVVRRWLKVVDPTALTARETLRRGLGFGPAVIDVARSDVLAFRWEGAVDARGILERLAEDTNLLQNPNKHHWELAVGTEPLHPGGNIWVLVAREQDGAGLKETLDRRRLVPGQAPETARGILWELSLAGSPSERRRLAESMAVVRGRGEGLLSNPHVEDAVVLEAAPAARELAAILGLGPQVPVS